MRANRCVGSSPSEVSGALLAFTPLELLGASKTTPYQGLRSSSSTVSGRQVVCQVSGGVSSVYSKG